MKITNFINISIITILGVFLAIFLMPFSRDYYIYQNLFEESSNSLTLIDSMKTIELTYSTLAYFVKDFYFTAIILCMIALFIKLYFLSKLSSFGWIAILYYFSRFFILHEVTQIRISFGIAMLILGFLYLMESKKKGYIFLILAVITHTTTLLYIPIIIYASKVKDPKLRLITLIKNIGFLILFLIFFIGSGILYKMPLDDLISMLPDQRLAIYYVETYDYEVPNLLTDVFLYLKIIALLIIAFSFKKGININGLEDDFCYRTALVFSVSIIYFIVFHEIYTIAARLSEIGALFECFVMTLFVIRISRLNVFKTSKFGAFSLRLLLITILAFRLLIAQLPLLEF